jgi:hypothetical protein
MLLLRRTIMLRKAHGAYAIVAALLLICAATADAQVDRATLTGIVRDPTDAMIGKAVIKVTSLATNAVVTATTTADGTYLVVNLAPGEYLVQVEAPGFQRFEQTVSLEIGARSRLDVSLAVGSVGETVTVEGVTPLLSTENAVLGTVVARNEVDKLPLAIRNWDDLLALVPVCRAIATPSRRAARRPAAPAASACMAIAACRTTFCSTASPITASPLTCRS